MSNTEKASLESLLGDVQIPLSAEIGHTEIAVKELLSMKAGSVIPTGKIAGQPLDLLSEGRLFARGEVVVVNGKYGIRILDVAIPHDSPSAADSDPEGVQS